jgi:hypothetical protein
MPIIASNFAFSVSAGKSKVMTNAVALPGKMAGDLSEVVGRRLAQQAEVDRHHRVENEGITQAFTDDEDALRKFSESEAGLREATCHHLPLQPPRLGDLVQVAVVAGDPKDDEAKNFLVVDADEVVTDTKRPTLRDVDGKAVKQVGDFTTRDQLFE